MSLDNTPAIYCGTYAKYNGGSLFGKWFDLDEFSNKDEFIDACMELHSDEDDPELMFQDWENIPGDMCSESRVSASVWDYMEACKARPQDALDAYIDEFHPSNANAFEVGKFDDRFIGETSLRDYAEELFDENEECPKHLRNYIDMDAYANDLECGGGYAERNGYLFRCD